ncbi:zinc finger protein 43-like isoform X2 [Neoarius graeffei]|uniref:zinc finger protein 43-like isoform X2 n=1 Tax=Neoarius graeffei TaxID=443677 RepID=UPI00298CD210|nr:zinc finger protein 43-like isoform X2 [Neoarius graeffei]
MVYCAAYGCNNSNEKCPGVSFFAFPKDPKLRKVWAHYCRRKNFVPTVSHKLCSDHFTEDSFNINPQVLSDINCQAKFKRLLKDGAVPNVPIQEQDGGVKPKVRRPPRGAFAKRLKAQVIADLLIAETQPVNQEKSTSQTLLGNHVGCQTDPPGRSSQGTQLSLRRLSPRVRTKGTQVTGSVNVEVGTTTTDAPWTKRCPLASPPFKALRPAKRPRLDFEEEDRGELSTEVPEPQAPTDDPVESVTVTIESSQFSSTEVMVNTQCLLELFQFCWFCQRECCTTIEGNEKLSSVTQDCKSCGDRRDWMSHPPTSLSSDEEASLSEEEEKKKRKRKSDSSDEWEPCLDEEATDSDVSMDEDLFTALKEEGQGKLVVWCTQCETEASRSCSILKHKKVFCCSQCRTGDDVQTHNCEILPVQFDDVASFQMHVEQEHRAKPFNILCQDCGKFVRANKEHVCEHKIKLIVCSDCGKRFLTEVGLKAHYNQVHLAGDHPCKYCLKVFKTKSAKLDHEQTHPKETPSYSCPDCPQMFREMHKRDKHVRSHRGPRKHVCDVCNKVFKYSTRLRRHKLIHSGEKPFKCQVCERSFNQVVNLTSHMRVHTGEKPFMCEQCGESFSHNVSLKNHKQRHHDSGSTQEEEIMSDLEENDL